MSTNPIKRLFDLYTSDMNFDEIDRLIKKESSEVYKFFANDIPKPDTTKNKFIRALIFIRSLFNAFILKLSAARRIFYIAALVIFFIGYLQNIGSYIIFAFVILNLLLAFELADKLSTKDELDLARKIQNNLIPKPPYNIPNFEVAAHYEPAREVGGDYFDLIKRENSKDEQLLVIGDISGKGIAAALYMVRVQAIIHLLASRHSNLKEIVINLKKYFFENLEKEYFLTLNALKFSGRGKLNFIRAGHLPMLRYKSRSGEIEKISPKGLGIGFNDKGLFEKALEQTVIKPESGDIFALFTDGISECMDEFNNQFGMKKLIDIIKENHNLSAEEIKSKIIKAVTNFRGSAFISDDITLVILKAK